MSRRLQALDLAIERAPDAPVNYLLRGEYWLEVGEVDLARQDLQMARDLAKGQAEASDWGYIYQSYHDRAEELLKRLD
jgi:Tfp pilus assembly protein PilF